MTDVCPHCKRPFAPKFRLSGFIQQRIVDVIAAHPDGIESWPLAEALYAGTKDPPQTWRKVIHVSVYRARKRVELAGWTIKSSRGRDARYTLVPLVVERKSVLVKHEHIGPPIGR